MKIKWMHIEYVNSPSTPTGGVFDTYNITVDFEIEATDPPEALVFATKGHIMTAVKRPRDDQGREPRSFAAFADASEAVMLFMQQLAKGNYPTPPSPETDNVAVLPLERTAEPPHLSRN